MGRCIDTLAERGLLQRLYRWSLILDLTTRWAARLLLDAMCGGHSGEEAKRLLREARDALYTVTRLVNVLNDTLVREASVGAKGCRVEVFAPPVIYELQSLLDDAVEAVEELEDARLAEEEKTRLRCGWLTAVLAKHGVPATRDHDRLAAWIEPEILVCDGRCRNVVNAYHDAGQRARRDRGIRALAEAFNALGLQPQQ